MSAERTQIESGGHAEDGALIALMDGEPIAQAGTASHVQGCASCAERLRVLEQRATRITHHLTLLDEPHPDAAAARQRLRQRNVRIAARRSWLGYALRAATVILLLGGVAAAMPALRELVSRFSSAGTSSSPAPAPSRPAAEDAAVAAGEPGTLIAFEPANAMLVVRIANVQAAGALDIVSHAERRVTAQVVANGGGEELLVLPAELQILNGRSSRAHYRVAVPEAMQVTVIVAGDTLFRGSPGAGKQVPLRH